MNIKLKCIEVLDGEEFTRGKLYEIESIKLHKESIVVEIIDDQNDRLSIILRKIYNYQSTVWQSNFRIQLIPVVRDSVQ